MSFLERDKVDEIRSDLRKRGVLRYQGNYFWPSDYVGLLSSLLTCNTFDYNMVMEAAAVALEDQRARTELLERALGRVLRHFDKDGLLSGTVASVKEQQADVVDARAALEPTQQEKQE